MKHPLIPITSDVADAVGPAGSDISNASLILDKMVFHKRWGLSRDTKADEASRWSLLRITDGAGMLRTEASRKRKQSDGHDMEEDNREQLRKEADQLDQIAGWRGVPEEIRKMRSDTTRRLLQLSEKSFGSKARSRTARLRSRMAINLSDGLIENAGICLDRVSGLPYIPGSAIKGVCRHAAFEMLRKDSGNETKQTQSALMLLTCFGDSEAQRKDLEKLGVALADKPTDNKGAVTFLPAFPASSKCELEVDVTTVHVPHYYMGRNGRRGQQPISAGTEHGLREENLRPNSFPVVKSGSLFGFVIALNDLGNRSTDPQALLNYAEKCLEMALTSCGIGAKTGAGYGWFELTPEIDEEIRRERNVAAAEASAREERGRLEPDAAIMEDLRKLPEDQLRGKINPYAVERRAWTTPDDIRTEDIYRRSIFEFFTVADRSLLEAEAAKRKSKLIIALNNLAEYLNLEVPQ